MIYFAYKKNTGDFDGFYNDEIHKEIPKDNLKIDESLWQELLKDNYKVNLEVLSDLDDKELALEDKDNVFIKIEIEPDNKQIVLSKTDVLMKELADIKLEAIKQSTININLAKRLSETNIKQIKQQELNNSLAQELAKTKIDLMKINMKGGNK